MTSTIRSVPVNFYTRIFSCSGLYHFTGFDWIGMTHADKRSSPFRNTCFYLYYCGGYVSFHISFVLSLTVLYYRINRVGDPITLQR